jgi:hypothetical protein
MGGGGGRRSGGVLGGGDRAQRGQLTLRVGAARELTPGKPVQ